MPPPTYQTPAPTSSYTSYPNRPRRGIFLHHTATSHNAPTPVSSQTGSWHRIYLPDGSIRLCVPTTAAAYTVLKTDVFRPTWLLRCPNGRVSDANYCSDNWEIQYAPQAPFFETPTHQQIASLEYSLAEHHALYGPTPILGHGLVQSDKWPTEPHALPYNLLRLSQFVPYTGYFYVPPPNPPMNPATNEEIKGWLETYGVGINPDTAIMRFAYECYRQGPPPHGNWRGPALPPPGQTSGGEYTLTKPDGTIVTRHRFTQGIAEYNHQTGGVGWLEVVLHPEEI